MAKELDVPFCMVGKANKEWQDTNVAIGEKLKKMGDRPKYKKEDFPVKEIPLDRVVATQPTLSAKKFNQYANSKSRSSHPQVIKHNDNYYVNDGHHRLAADRFNGKSTSKAHVVDLDE